MLKTLRISFALKNTYSVNAILYSIKQIPLLGPSLPGHIYQIRGFKILGNVIAAIKELGGIFLGKLVYFVIMLLAASGLLMEAGVTLRGVEPDGGALFLHILLWLTVIGAFLNNTIFDPTKDKYYAIILLGMDSRSYTLINYGYTLLKVLLGFGLFSCLFGNMLALELWQCLMIPLYVAGVKVVGAAVGLYRFRQKRSLRKPGKANVAMLIAIPVLLALAYGLPLLGLHLPKAASIGCMALGIVLGLLCAGWVVKFPLYRDFCRQSLTASMLDEQAGQTELLVEQSHSSITMEADFSSGKTGFEYLNELFIRRHKKILWRSSKHFAIGAAVALLAVLALFLIVPASRSAVNGMLMTALPYSVFVMYLINRGAGFTRALFINCDHSLLTYAFYKQPKFILKLFQIRLREIIKVNLLPAAVIGFGLAVLLLASGGTEDPMNYVVLVVSILCLSVFFSVHYLTLYYLLQPYNAGTELKSGTYKLAMWLTYFVSYMLLQFELPTLLFGLATIVFCVVYCAVACILAYRLAPKTFKLRM